MNLYRGLFANSCGSTLPGTISFSGIAVQKSTCGAFAAHCLGPETAGTTFDVLSGSCADELKEPDGSSSKLDLNVGGSGTAGTALSFLRQGGSSRRFRLAFPESFCVVPSPALLAPSVCVGGANGGGGNGGAVALFPPGGAELDEAAAELILFAFPSSF